MFLNDMSDSLGNPRPLSGLIIRSSTMPHALFIMCNTAAQFFALVVISITLSRSPVAAQNTEWPFSNIYPHKYRQGSRVYANTMGAKNICNPEANVSWLKHTHTNTRML